MGIFWGAEGQDAGREGSSSPDGLAVLKPAMPQPASGGPLCPPQGAEGCLCLSPQRARPGLKLILPFLLLILALLPFSSC